MIDPHRMRQSILQILQEMPTQLVGWNTSTAEHLDERLKRFSFACVGADNHACDLAYDAAPILKDAKGDGRGLSSDKGDEEEKAPMHGEL